MSRSTSPRKESTPLPRSVGGKPGFGGRRTIAAAKFKPVCLRLMEQVRETGVEIVITKHGQPVAKLVAFTDNDLTPFVGRSRGAVRITADDLMAPIGADWEPGADL